MSDRVYMQHGRRHAPGGTDPIPGLGGGGMVWAALGNAARVTVPAASGGVPGVKLIDMNTSVDYTNDSSVFDIATFTDGTGTYHGLAYQAVGHYLAKWQLIFDAITGTGQISAVAVNEDGTNATPAAYGSEGRVWTRNTDDSGQDGWYLETLATVTAAMTKPFLMQVSNGTDALLTVDLNMIAFQLDTDPTVFF